MNSRQRRATIDPKANQGNHSHVAQRQATPLILSFCILTRVYWSIMSVCYWRGGWEEAHLYAAEGVRAFPSLAQKPTIKHDGWLPCQSSRCISFLALQGFQTRRDYMIDAFYEYYVVSPVQMNRRREQIGGKKK